MGCTDAIEHWDGTSWSVVPSPNPHPCSTSGAGDMAAVSPSDIFALAAGVIEQWNGTNWSIIASGPTGSGSGAVALGDGAVVVVGANGDGTILKN
jgi:hypothetical protein